MANIDHLDGGEIVSLFKLQFDCEQIDILIENLGRLSDLTDRNKFIEQRKGLLANDAIQLKTSLISDLKISPDEWKIHFIDFSQRFYSRVYPNSEWESNESNAFQPCMAFTKFNVNKVKSLEIYEKKSSTVNYEFKEKGVYLLMKNWNRGFVFINGFNLGRFTSSGPLATLFVPNFLLNIGINELLIFETSKMSNSSVYFARSHIQS